MADVKRKDVPEDANSKQLNCNTKPIKLKQTDYVLSYLMVKKRITSMDAFRDLGITRLSARIWDLRHEGYSISSNNETSKNRHGVATSYCVYELEDTE